ncbi:MAG: hypothetical protein JW861_07400 [Bacteroidales bacterium]|nr:hypothetical protein [Bacteroidales bacterium]
MSKPPNYHTIVFLGDSLTEGFDLSLYIPRPGLVNRGISGDMTLHILYRRSTHERYQIH